MKTNLPGENSTCLLEFLTNFEKNLMDISSKVQLLIDKSQGDVIQSGAVKQVYYCYGNRVHSVAEGQPAYFTLPPQLESDRAESIKVRLAEAGLIDDYWQPVSMSWSQSAVLAQYISERLGIRNVWQVFGRLWHKQPETLRKYFNTAMNQDKTLRLQEKLKKILGL